MTVEDAAEPRSLGATWFCVAEHQVLHHHADAETHHDHEDRRCASTRVS